MGRKKTPLFLRSISNWKKYRAYINQYQGVRDDLVQLLLRKTTEHGFNEGVEQFELKVGTDNWYNKERKKFQLEKLANTKPITIEDMIEEKKRMERIEEEKKTYKYDPNYKPTLEDLVKNNYQIVHQKYVSPIMYFRIYHVHDKMVHVGVSVVPGKETMIFTREKFSDVKEVVGTIFKSFSPTLGQEEKKEEIKIDIDHVKKAMGIDTDTNKTKSDDNKKLNDLLDDIF